MWAYAIPVNDITFCVIYFKISVLAVRWNQISVSLALFWSTSLTLPACLFVLLKLFFFLVVNIAFYLYIYVPSFVLVYCQLCSNSTSSHKGNNMQIYLYEIRSKIPSPRTKLFVSDIGLVSAMIIFEILPEHKYLALSILVPGLLIWQSSFSRELRLVVGKEPMLIKKMNHTWCVF